MNPDFVTRKIVPKTSDFHVLTRLKPVRFNWKTKNPENHRRRWQTDCGRASLVIRAGELAHPDKPNDLETCAVSAEPKARFLASLA